MSKRLNRAILRPVLVLTLLMTALLISYSQTQASPTAPSEGAVEDSAAQTGTARVRVAHASPDAPNVDILVDDSVAFADVAFEEITDYADLPAGTYNIKVTPAGANQPVVIEADLDLSADTDYTVAAVGELAAIEPLVLVDDNSPPEPGKAHVRFVHASPNAPAVDVAVAGGPVLFSNIAFKEATDYLPVDAGVYDLEVRLAGESTVVLELPGVELEASTVNTVFATGLVDVTPLTAVPSVDSEGKARVRVAHASPDVGNVRVLVDDNEAFDHVVFKEITDYAELAPGTYNVKVQQRNNNDILFEADLTLEAGTDYTVLAIRDVVAGDHSLTARVLVDDNSAPPAGQAKVRFVHASPNAPVVDVVVAGGGPVLFDDFAYEQVSDYLPVDAGTYDLEVLVAASGDTALSVPQVVLEEGTVYTVYAMGLVGFGGQKILSAEISVDSEAAARVRVAHASPDAPNVDVLVDDAPAFTDVAFKDITPYAALPPATYNVKVVPTGETTPVVIEADLPLAADTDYTVVAAGKLADIAPVVLVDDNSPPPAGQANVRFVHASPNAPAVDVAVADGGPVLFSNISFTEAGDYVTVASGEYDLEVRAAGTNTVVLSVPGVSLAEYTVYTIFAEGLFNATPLNALVSVDRIGQTRVRVVHASPDAPNVDVLVDGAVAFGDVAFEEVTDYASLTPGTYNIQVVPAGAANPVVIDATLPLLDGQDYTIVAAGRLADIEPLVLTDDNSDPAAGKAHVRFVHASPNAPAVDVAVTGGPVLFDNVAFKDVTDYLPVDAGTYDLEVRIAGTTTVVLALPGNTLREGGVYTVYATGLVGEDPPLNAVFSFDNSFKFAEYDYYLPLIIRM